MAGQDDRVLAELERLRRRLAERRDGGGSGFLSGLALGLLAGGALALAFAPRAGEETREQWRETSIELKDRASRVAEQARDQAGALQAQAQGALGGVRERAQTLGETAKEQVQTATTRRQGGPPDVGQPRPVTAERDEGAIDITAARAPATRENAGGLTMADEREPRSGIREGEGGPLAKSGRGARS